MTSNIKRFVTFAIFGSAVALVWMDAWATAHPLRIEEQTRSSARQPGMCVVQVPGVPYSVKKYVDNADRCLSAAAQYSQKLGGMPVTYSFDDGLPGQVGTVQVRGVFSPGVPARIQPGE